MATPHNMIKAFVDAFGVPTESVTLRDANLQTGSVIPLGAEDFSSALISIDNDLDQSVDVIVQGSNANEGSWHTVITATTVVAGGNDHVNLGETWNSIRITYQAAGIPTTGTLRCGVQRARGGGLIESAAGGIAVDVNVTDRAARDLGKVDIAGIDSIGTVVGQKAMAASLPVVIASNQTVIPVSDNAGTLTVDDGAGSLTVDQGTHDNLLVNATLQIADVDVGDAGTAIPIRDGGNVISIDDGAGTITVDDGATTLSIDDGAGAISVDDNASSLTVDQNTHDNLLVNATLQVADVDVSATVPVPVQGFSDLIEVTYSLDTNIYATNDLLADTQVITNACANSRPVILYSLRIIDLDAQAKALDVLILRSNTSVGTENLAYAPSDAMGSEVLWRIPIAAADWTLETAYSVAHKTLPDGIGCVLKPAVAGTSLWTALVCRSGTPTYTASGIKASFGFVQNG